MNYKLLVLVSAVLISSNLAADEQSKVYRMDEIVVTATKSEESISNVSQDVDIITEEQIEQSNAQSIGDVLKYIPGMNLSMSDDIPGKSTWRTTLRGLSIDNGYVLFLIDGQRVKGRGMGEYGNGLNHIPVEMIDRIEVVKGPSSVLYGSDAVGGVINIITKPTSKEQKISVFANYGSREIAREGITYSNTVGNVGFRTNIVMERANIDEYDSRYFNNRLTYNANRVKYRLDVNVNDIDTESQDERRYNLAPDVTFDLGNTSKLSVKAYFYNWHFTHGSRYGDINWNQAEAQYTKIVAQKHSIAVGSEFLRQGMDYHLKGVVIDNVQQWSHLDKDVDNISVYAQDEWSVIDRVRFTLGSRFDHHSQYDGVFSPRLSGLYDVTESIRLRASVGRSFKAATMRQMYYPGLFMHSTTNYVRSNPDLKPEYSTGYTLSLEKVFGSQFWASVMAYRNDLTDMVKSYDTGKELDDLPITSYENVEEAYTQGIEGELSFQVIKGLTGRITAAYTDAENKDTKRKLTYIPGHTEGLQLDYFDFRYRVGLNWRMIYYGEVYTNNDNTRKNSGYLMAEVKIRKNVTPQVMVSVECDNIFDSDYGIESSSRVPRTYFVKLTYRQ